MSSIKAFLSRYLISISLHRAAFHSQKIILFIYTTPIDNLTEFIFENVVEPNAYASSVALTERMGDIHFHIFFYNFIKRRLSHFINIFKRRFQIHNWRKSKISFCYINRSDLSCKIVNPIKKVFVNGFQGIKLSCIQCIKYSVFKKLQCFFSC